MPKAPDIVTPRPRKKVIHVNQHVIRANAKTGSRDPTLTVKMGGKTFYGHEVEIHGPSKVVYSPDKPLSCGAKVWIETKAEVTLHDYGISHFLTNGALK